MKKGKKMKLVMSDEYSRDGRGFAPGQDLIFEALEKPGISCSLSLSLIFLLNAPLTLTLSQHIILIDTLLYHQR